MSIDNREKYANRPWERHVKFAKKLERHANDSVYEALAGRKCYAQVQGWQLVYCFGSEEECTLAMTKHNNELKLRALLLDTRDKFGTTGFININAYMEHYDK